MSDDERMVLWRWSAKPNDYTFDPRKPFPPPPTRTSPYTYTFHRLDVLLTELGETALSVHESQRQYHWPDSPTSEWLYDEKVKCTIMRANDLHQHFQRFHPAYLKRDAFLMRVRHGLDLDVQPLVRLPSGSYWIDGALGFADDQLIWIATVLLFQTEKA